MSNHFAWSNREESLRAWLRQVIHRALRGLNQFFTSLPANRKAEIDRFKGLGEMNADQLKQTTLDPATRTLVRIDIESQIDADRTFQQLLGKDPSERYRVIMEEASFADDLDL